MRNAWRSFWAFVASVFTQGTGALSNVLYSVEHASGGVLHVAAIAEEAAATERLALRLESQERLRSLKEQFDGAEIISAISFFDEEYEAKSRALLGGTDG